MMKRQDTIKKLQARMMNRLMKANPAFLQQCEFRPVRNGEELKKAAHLVYLEYIQKQYAKPNSGELRLFLHQFLSKSTTLIALYQKKHVIATITLLEDSALGMPIDKVFKGELDQFRVQGRKMFEAGMLATDNQALGETGLNLSSNDRMVLILHLFKATVHFFRNTTDWDMMVACFHPKHEFFYQGIDMERFADLKSYDNVEGNPALGYYWDLTKMESNPSGPIQKFFGYGTPKNHSSSIHPYHWLKIEEFGEIFIQSTAK